VSNLPVLDDRFKISELADIQHLLRRDVEILEPQMAVLLADSTTTFAATQGEFADEPVVPLHAHLAVSTCFGVGRNLLDLDIELRRTAAYLNSGRTRPTRDNQVIEVNSAEQSSSIDVVLVAGREIYHLLTSRPIAFLQTLDWFWLRRHTRTKVRNPDERVDPMNEWSEMLLTVRALIERGNPALVRIDVAADGTTTFTFGT
jgi:hypothetical protein